MTPQTLIETELELRDGQRLSQAEFHRRYLAYPKHIKFELIGGVVHMPSPMRVPHGLYTAKLCLILGLYEAATPGVVVADGITAILGDDSEPQPDLLLWILPEYGGASRRNVDQYLEGSPELVAEVSHSTQAIDLGAKREDYRAGVVREYLVICLDPLAIRWFDFAAGDEIQPTKAGLYKSRFFPGLWIDGRALLALDSPKLIAAAQKGVASREHARFVYQLQQRRETP